MAKRSLAELSAYFPHHKAICEIFERWKSFNLKKFSQVTRRIFNNNILCLLLGGKSQKMPSCPSETWPNQHVQLHGFYKTLSPLSCWFYASSRLCSSSLTQHRKGVLGTQILYLWEFSKVSPGWVVLTDWCFQVRSAVGLNQRSFVDFNRISLNYLSQILGFLFQQGSELLEDNIMTQWKRCICLTIHLLSLRSKY